jgi:transcription elongation factor GreA
MKKIQFTQDGLDKLKIEYQNMINGKRPKAIERLSKARAMGDLSENSEYTAAKEDLSFVEGRIRELEELMKNAEVIPQDAKSGTVDVGCVVVVEKDGEKDQFIIVGEFEADPIKKKLSQTSPIGKALLGKKVGEFIQVEVPIGKIVYKIVEIKKS